MLPLECPFVFCRGGLLESPGTHRKPRPISGRLRHSPGCWGLAIGLAAATLAVSAQAAPSPWPAFRGPNSAGLATEGNPPTQFGPTNAVVWKTAVPWSPSSPCVWGEQVFVTTYAGGELEVRAHRSGDGGLAWRRGVKPERLEMFHGTEGSPAGSSPALDAGHVVAYFASFGVLCFDHSGKELWRRELPVGMSLGGYGTATSPVIAGDRVLVSRDLGEKSSLLALDLGTGRTVWETKRPNSQGSFGTPVVWRNEGIDQVVVPGCLRLQGYDLSTGREAWHVEGLCAFPCTTPVVAGDTLYYGAWTDGKADAPWPSWDEFRKKHDTNQDGAVMLTEFDDGSRDYYRGFDANLNGRIDEEDLATLQASLRKGENLMVAVKPGGRGDITRSHVLWQATKGVPYIASPVIYDGRIYTIRSGGMMSSFDVKSGTAAYLQERLGVPGYYYASLVAGAGRLYVAAHSGKVMVLKAGGERPEVLHQADFQEPIYATPALSGDRLYLRTHDHLYALGGS